VKPRSSSSLLRWSHPSFSLVIAMQRTVATLLAASLLASSAEAKAASFPLHRPVSMGTMSVSGFGTLFADTTAPAPGPTASGETETFDTLVAQATGKFKDKDYAGAVALFERAYAAQPEPAILFNIGRIYEEAQNAEAAIGYYEKFIADESVELKDREKAVTRLQVLRTIVEIREKEKNRNKPKPVEPPPVTDPAPVVGPTPPANQPPQTDTKPKPGRLLRPIGGAMLGTGAALLIGGAISGGIAKGAHNEFTSAKTLADRETAANRGRSLAATADGLFIAGGVIAAVGIVLLIVPAVRKSRTAQALQPQVSPTQVGLGFTHRF
jgi:tetratricopeptide (TPR) repeat protein